MEKSKRSEVPGAPLVPEIVEEGQGDRCFVVEIIGMCLDEHDCSRVERNREEIICAKKSLPEDSCRRCTQIPIPDWGFSARMRPSCRSISAQTPTRICSLRARELSLSPGRSSPGRNRLHLCGDGQPRQKDKQCAYATARTSSTVRS